MTAVEWLTEKLFNDFGLAFSDNIIEQAKEMEKQQIIDAFKEGTKMVDINDELSAGFNGVMYFYETYDKKNG